MKDTFYVSHGSPTLSIDESMPARHFLQSWKNTVLSQSPTSILVISGHWETKYPTVSVVQRNQTIHDFYGFPDRMYKVPSCSLRFFNSRFISLFNDLLLTQLNPYKKWCVEKYDSDAFMFRWLYSKCMYVCMYWDQLPTINVFEVQLFIICWILHVDTKIWEDFLFSLEIYLISVCLFIFVTNWLVNWSSDLGSKWIRKEGWISSFYAIWFC